MMMMMMITTVGVTVKCDEDEEVASCPACLPAEEWLMLTLLESLSSSCANMLSLPQGSMLQVALRTQGVAARVQPDCFFSKE